MINSLRVKKKSRTKPQEKKNTMGREIGGFGWIEKLKEQQG